MTSKKSYVIYTTLSIFKCPICNKILVESWYYTKSQRVRKHYTCSLCNKLYQESNLK